MAKFWGCPDCGIRVEGARGQVRCKDCKKAAARLKAQKFELTHMVSCPQCSKPMGRKAKLCRVCADEQRWMSAGGENHYRWQGGETVDQRGYVQVLVPPERRKGHRYQSQHRVVWEDANGPIPEGHIVHHKNEVKTDNRLENLECITRKEHSHIHGVQRIHELEAEVAALKRRLGDETFFL